MIQKSPKSKNDANSLMTVEEIALKRVEDSPLHKVLKDYARDKSIRSKSNSK
jgi:hypothetical protein